MWAFGLCKVPKKGLKISQEPVTDLGISLPQCVVGHQEMDLPCGPWHNFLLGIAYQEFAI